MSLKDLSPSEVYVLSLIYENDGAEIYEILESMSKEWRYTTVLTFATRLYDKGYVEKKKNGKRYIYSPKYSREDSFRIIMERMFGHTILNEPACMVNYLLRSDRLNKSSKKKLEDLLKRL